MTLETGKIPLLRLKSFILDIALLAGPQVTIVGQQNSVAMVPRWQVTQRMADTDQVTVNSRLDLIEARPHPWQLKVAGFALGCPLDQIGVIDGAPLEQRFVWLSEDYFNAVWMRPQKSPVHFDELRSDVQRQLYWPENKWNTAVNELAQAVQSARAEDNVGKLFRARNAQLRGLKKQAAYAKKIERLLCISIASPVPSSRQPAPQYSFIQPEAVPA